MTMISLCSSASTPLARAGADARRLAEGRHPKGRHRLCLRTQSASWYGPGVPGCGSGNRGRIFALAALFEPLAIDAEPQ